MDFEFKLPFQHFVAERVPHPTLPSMRVLQRTVQVEEIMSEMADPNGQFRQRAQDIQPITPVKPLPDV